MDAETGLWKSKNNNREDDGRRYFSPMASPKKVNAFSGALRFLEDKGKVACCKRKKLMMGTVSGQRGGRLLRERQYTTDNDPKGVTRKRRCKNFPRPPPMALSKEQPCGIRISIAMKEGRLDHLVKNIKEGKDKQRSGGKKDAPRDKADTIYMVQSWQRKTKQKVSQKFSHGSGISFPTLTADNAVVEPLTIEINAAGHDIHRMYIDGGASADILYEHCFQRLRPEVKSQLNPATTSLTGFTGEKIWPMGQLRLPVMVGNKEHSTTAWMNFMVIRSPSPYNGIIGRPGISAIRAGTLPHEQKDARRIRRTARRFELRNGVLYRRSFLQPWLRCVGPIQADYVLHEIHAGSCSMHSGPRSVVARALRSGYYWPTMHRDARDMIKKCNDCQVHRPIPRQPQQELTPITSPWPFHKWGIDIVGPFPVAAGGLKFLIVAIDYFTKWIEAKAVATITGNQVKRFVWDNIVCRFGLPGEIVSDNGKQFCDNPFKDWCARLSITQRFASVKHPQTNGLVERANRSLGEGIKARLDRHKGRWVEELSHVLWAHRTTIKVSTGDTPFSLVYGTEAVIPAEIGMPTIRTAEVNIATNDDERRIDLDILEERREQAAIREEKAKLKMKGYYDAKVRGVSFRPGDFVYRANDASHAEDTGKLGPKWEGPYEVTEALGKGAYKLRDMDGRELPRTWNICNLKKCYL
ncbi:reverse transcriptase domain-containing protein [Tanacetum coccineum]